ncbi:MAG: hypothetical protein D3926_21500 [Desulfobacteraceae bacterium]|nr:MAG: hypothetical protein D3926_21500 [Desulfobacteraceae bacterium]
MTTDRYTIHKTFLYFLDPSVESRYREYILDRAMTFTRVSWGIVILLGVAFSVLDRQFFGESAGLVMILRAIVIFVALTAIFISRSRQHRSLMDWNGFIFVLTLGMFCNLLLLLDTVHDFSIYFTGFFLIFPGVFCTAGLGFRYSWVALILTMAGFVFLFGVISPMPADLLAAYCVFMGGLVLIYLYLAFLVEHIFRKNYITSEKLKVSLSEVHQLSGLLPICAQCKKIRDDKGYWQQVETYIQNHSQAEFSHGLCPACLEAMYGDKAWFKKMKS